MLKRLKLRSMLAELQFSLKQLRRTSARDMPKRGPSPRERERSREATTKQRADSSNELVNIPHSRFSRLTNLTCSDIFHVCIDRQKHIGITVYPLTINPKISDEKSQ